MMYVVCKFHLYFIHFLSYQILDEDGFVGDLRTQSSDIQNSIDKYDTPRLVKTTRSRFL